MFKITTFALLFARYHMVNGYDCCIDATTEDDCNAVASGCTYIANDEAAMKLSAGAVCVTPSWIECTVNGNCPPPPPVPPAPSDCIIDTCQNTDDTFNVGFIVDESGSVGPSNYKRTLDYFVKKMINENLNEADLVSFLSFSTGTDDNWGFSSKGGASNTNREGVLHAVEMEKNDFNGGTTCLGNAVQEMIQDYAEDLLSVPAEQRGKKNVLFILTDGIASCMSECGAIRNQLRELEIYTYVVGITNGFSPAAVLCLIEDQMDPSDPRYDEEKTTYHDYILSIPLFEPQYFYSLQMQLRRTVCPPIVFEEEVTDPVVNKLYFILNDGANDMMKNNYLVYVVTLTLLSIGGLVYCFRKKLFSRNNGDQYMPLKDGLHGQYQSV